MKQFQLAAFADEAGSLLSEQITAMRRHDIPYLEIRGVDGQSIAALSCDKAREVRKKLDDAGIMVWSLGSPYGKIDIREAFAPHLDAFRHGLELADILGAGHIRLFSFYIPAGERPAAFRDDVMERLSRFVDAAAGSGITLCHENEKGIYGDVATRCADIHSALPSLKAVFDPANFIQCGQPVGQAWSLLAPYVAYMHVKDALADGTVVPAGCGIGQWPLLLSQYTGSVLTLEPHLAVFEGLAALEQDGHKTDIPAYQYPTPQAAFAAAADAIKALIK